MISSLTPLFCFLAGCIIGAGVSYLFFTSLDKQSPYEDLFFPDKSYKPPEQATIVQLKSAEDLLEEKLKNENENI